MRVAMPGRGAIGLGSAALLCAGGHEAVLWSPSGASARRSPRAPLLAEGAVAGSFRPAVARTCAEALADADCVLVAVPGYAPPRGDRGGGAAPAAGAMGAVQLAHVAGRAAAAPALPRRAGGGLGQHGAHRAAHAARPRCGSTPSAGAWTRRACRATTPRRALRCASTLFGDRFVPRDGLLAIALSNLNPQNHMAIALCNLTRMETWRGVAAVRQHHAAPWRG